MTTFDAQWVFSIVCSAMGALMALLIWFIRRYVASQDDNNKFLNTAIERLKNESQALDKMGSEFSSNVQHRLESLDDKTQYWVMKLEGLVTHASDLTQSLFKIETRVMSLSEKLTSLEDKISKAESRLVETISQVQALTLPIEHVKVELDQSAKLISAMVIRLKENGEEIKTLKIAVGPDSKFITSKRKT